jgi:endonuclease G
MRFGLRWALVGLLALAGCATPKKSAESPTPPAAKVFSATVADSEKGPLFAGLPISDHVQLTILTNIGYMVGYDEGRRNPAWVCYRLYRLSPSDLDAKLPERPGNYFQDKRTRSQVPQNALASTGYDHGHMAPNAAMFRCYGQKAEEESFLMSNMCPQAHSVNAGKWKVIETRELNKWAQEFGEVWIIAGPIFGRRPILLARTGIQVPDAFFKIIVENHGGTVRALAFRIPAAVPPMSKLEDFLTSVHQIEAETGIDFLAELPKTVQDSIEGSRAPKIW